MQEQSQGATAQLAALTQMSPKILPDTITPAAFARHMGWSERRVRQQARALGACRVLGNRMVLTQSDVETLLEAARPCPSKSSGAGRFGTTGGPLPGGDYATLLKTRAKSKNIPRATTGRNPR